MKKSHISNHMQIEFQNASMSSFDLESFSIERGEVIIDDEILKNHNELWC